MATRTLDSSPSILPLYARAAAPLIPGASRLPFVPGRGKDVPDLELSLAGVRPDPEAIAAYAKVCGFSLRDDLPPTYPHVLAFPLHMAVMADGSFPFGAVGLVHVENRIVQHRPIGLDEELRISRPPDRAAATQARPDLRPRHRGLRRQREGLGVDQHDAPPWQAPATAAPMGLKRPNRRRLRPIGRRSWS